MGGADLATSGMAGNAVELIHAPLEKLSKRNIAPCVYFLLSFRPSSFFNPVLAMYFPFRLHTLSTQTSLEISAATSED